MGYAGGTIDIRFLRPKIYVHVSLFHKNEASSMAKRLQEAGFELVSIHFVVQLLAIAVCHLSGIGSNDIHEPLKSRTFNTCDMTMSHYIHLSSS